TKSPWPAGSPGKNSPGPHTRERFSSRGGFPSLAHSSSTGTGTNSREAGRNRRTSCDQPEETLSSSGSTVRGLVLLSTTSLARSATLRPRERADERRRSKDSRGDIV